LQQEERLLLPALLRRLLRVPGQGPFRGQGLPQPSRGGHTEVSQSVKCRVQNGGTVGRETTWDQRRTMRDVRRYERCYVLGSWFL
jgi:hypothetical protein